MFQTKSRRAGVWLITSAFFLIMLGVTLPTPLYPIYEHRYTFAPVMITVIFSAYAGGTITALLFCGHLSDEIGRRHVLLPGVGIAALSAVTFIAARGIPELLLGRVLSGLSAGIFSATAPAAIVDLVPPEERRKASTIAIGGDVLGLACGPLTAGLLAQNLAFPIRVPYAVDLALLIPATLALLLAPESVKPKGHGVHLRMQRLQIPGEIRSTFIRAAIAGMCGFAISGLFNAIVPSFLRTVLHYRSHALAGTLVFVFLAFAAAGQLGVQRLPRKGALPGACALMLAGLGLMTAGVVLGSLPLFFASAVLSGLGDGLALGFGIAQINQEIDERRGEITATYFVLLYIGISTSAIGVGLMATVVGLPVAALVFCGIVGALAFGVLLTLIGGNTIEP